LSALSAVLVTGVLASKAAGDANGGVLWPLKNTQQALQSAVLTTLPDVASVLVKGSRFMKMERVVQALAQCWTHRPRNGVWHADLA
jgi:UDP-N-acetylmuramoyl-tripeptide--D-alanyl-D-alanine ligase